MNLLVRLSLNFLCKKNSKKLSFTSLVSIVGICFGLSAFLVVITVLNSFQNELKNIISSVNPNVTIYSPAGLTNPTKLIKELEEFIPAKVEKMSSFVYHESILSNGKETATVYIRAIEGTNSASAVHINKYLFPENALTTLNISSPLIDENRNTLNDDKLRDQLPHVILGKGLADSLDAKIGTVVTLMSFTSEYKKVGIRYNKLYVTGIMNSGLSEFDKKQVLMNFQDGVKLFGLNNWASGIEINLKNPDEAIIVANKLNIDLPYNVIAWQEIHAGLFEQIKRDGTAIKLIVLIISFVAGFNIVVTLGLTVMNRAKQIAILRALGAKKSLVISSFVMSGLILGFLGSSLGVLTGLGILKIFSGLSLGDFQKFYNIERIPVHIDVTLIVFAFFTSLILSFIGALYPAWKASKVSPMLGISQGN
ncbi:ABC transporter permease [Pigmentibacter sp. JX0631]|uniref:FtsX-like permease family protein n=1 Tax=Pigmentibacter sp. JX0631 TaxID=2976982 RepID=UPI002469A612|nr:FtsX-like permease family protein [Pigmentibacter sp. JX0631]WGL59983.1 ABC transporter permease [Pigmentibacter sp. JX0631]